MVIKRTTHSDLSHGTMRALLATFGLLVSLTLLYNYCVISQENSFELQLHENPGNYCFHGTNEVSPSNYSEKWIKDDILSKLSDKIRTEVAKNLIKTEKSKMGRQWFIGQSACPYQIRRSSEKKLKKLPNAIGIGTGKSGTGRFRISINVHEYINFQPSYRNPCIS